MDTSQRERVHISVIRDESDHAGSGSDPILVGTASGTLLAFFHFDIFRRARIWPRILCIPVYSLSGVNVVCHAQCHEAACLLANSCVLHALICCQYALSRGVVSSATFS